MVKSYRNRSFSAYGLFSGVSLFTDQRISKAIFTFAFNSAVLVVVKSFCLVPGFSLRLCYLQEMVPILLFYHCSSGHGFTTKT